jgi:hypothetical protein
MNNDNGRGSRTRSDTGNMFFPVMPSDPLPTLHVPTWFANAFTARQYTENNNFRHMFYTIGDGICKLRHDAQPNLIALKGHARAEHRKQHPQPSGHIRGYG